MKVVGRRIFLGERDRRPGDEGVDWDQRGVTGSRRMEMMHVMCSVFMCVC